MQLIKIPAKHYVGLANQKDRLALGFMVPEGDDAAAARRKDSVDNWAKSRSEREMGRMKAITIDNQPLTGFKLTADIRSSRYGGDDKWRIEDPRGFELEITSGNLAQLLAVGVLDKGEIKDACVWARAGQNNILLSVETEEYKDALENTRVAEAATSWKEARIGNTVVLQNGVKGVWYGKMYLTGDSWSYDHEALYKNRLTTSKKPVHVIVETNDKGNYIVYTPAVPKLAEIRCRDTLTEIEAEQKINAIANETYISGAAVSAARFVTYKKPAAIRFALTKLDMDRFSQANARLEKHRAANHRPSVFIQLGDDFGQIVDGYGHRDPTLACFSRDMLEAGAYAELREDLSVDNRGYAWHGRRKYKVQRCLPLPAAVQSAIDDFYELTAMVDSTTGAQLTVVL